MISGRRSALNRSRSVNSVGNASSGSHASSSDHRKDHAPFTHRTSVEGSLTEHLGGGRELPREIAARRLSVRASRRHRSPWLPARRRNHLLATGTPGRPHDRTSRQRDRRRSQSAGRPRSEDSTELQERSADSVRLVVDQRVPSEYSTNCSGADIEGVEAACPERDARIGNAGGIDELGNQIHSKCRNPSVIEKVRPLARTAASVEYRTLDAIRPSRHQLTI